MYLTINEARHTVVRRIVSSDTIKYIGVTPEPTKITGTIHMYRDDGFLMSEDDSSKFSRKLCYGTLLQLTNKPELDESTLLSNPNPTAEKVVTAVVG